MNKQNRRQRHKSQTPIRAALRTDSSLRPKVCDGLGAIIASHHDYFEDSLRQAFADSLDLDSALKPGHEQESRWDYLLGCKKNNQIIALEPHSAANSEVGTVIKKRKAALDQLAPHLNDGKSIAKWFWVASGRVQFVPIEKKVLQLAQNGIKFVGRKLSEKHID